MQFYFVFLWTIFTLGVASLTVVVASWLGVEFIFGMLATLVVAAAILANKLVVVGDLIVPGGILLASTTFLLTDMLSEFWGKEKAQKAVWVGFMGLLLLISSLWIVQQWASPVFAQDKAYMFAEVLSSTPRITLASIIAYLISQHHDVWAYHLLKKLTGGRWLWLRNNVSTITSQVLDTVVFITIAFWGEMPLVPLMSSMLIVKILIALLDTPFIYAVSFILSKTPVKHKLLRREV